jgi:hypothetical protein
LPKLVKRNQSRKGLIHSTCSSQCLSSVAASYLEFVALASVVYEVHTLFPIPRGGELAASSKHIATAYAIAFLVIVGSDSLESAIAVYVKGAHTLHGMIDESSGFLLQLTN